jgi:UDP-N-acetylglucosamine acyltransferase
VAKAHTSLEGEIHPTAVIDATAELAPDVAVGPHSMIGPNVVVGNGTRIGSNVVIERDTTIGRDCRIHAGAVLGGDPQDLKYRGEPSRLVVGDRSVIREFVTLNRGTQASGRTVVGSDCLIMAYVHVAHDCVIGNHVVLANAVNMGGHIEIEDWAVVGGVVAIHQFARVGQHAIVGGASAVRKDVPPYTKAAGNPLRLYGLNTLGLERRGFADEVRQELRRAYRILFQSQLNVSQAIDRVRAELRPIPEVLSLLDFIERSKRGVTV